MCGAAQGVPTPWAGLGHADTKGFQVRTLGWAGTADWSNSQALVEATRHGHTEVARLLLNWQLQAPHADSQDSEALVVAASIGHATNCEMLLSRGENAGLRAPGRTADQLAL